MDKNALKEFLQRKYENPEAFLENVIFPIFGEENYDSSGNYHYLHKHPEDINAAESAGIVDILALGSLYVEGSQLDIFDITVSSKSQLANSRVSIQQLIRRIISTHSGAFMIFHYKTSDRWDWRFTFCHKGANALDSTDSKRYTFLLGPGQSCRTAAENFCKLGNKIATDGEFEMDDIIKAFDVEALSKEFFEKYKIRYGRFVGHVIGKEYIDKGDGKGEWKEKEGLLPSELFYGLNEDEKVARDYVKKLLGRIVFLHFLQKKGWLGSTDDSWTNGPQDFMYKLFKNASTDQKENFLDGILEPLFSCLDTPLEQRREVFDTKVDGLRAVRVPFLGGLFERTDEDKALSVFPAELFADFFEFLSEYNFTIDENDPNDAQVGVDPEMLGRIFENLLEDNKDKGAFYTPKEIVQYMCRESLIAYLQTDVTDKSTREALRQFVTTHDVTVLGGRDSALAINVSQCLKDVKICDPAIGSGAFPMGLLNELFLCRGVIEDFSNATEIKRHIIQQNIYGVDIEKGAVEIARLRFWLSLITDADKPDVLPNMDFKIMQGNSLLEQYKGFDLSHIIDTKTEIHYGHQIQMFEDRIDVIRAEVKNTIKSYYSEQNHDARRTMREGIQQKIQQQIAVQSINVDISDITDIAANDQFFLWHTWFCDVFEENGGFDIVIGNPPYIQLQNNGGELSKLYQPCGYESYSSMGDIYCLFYERGWQLLKDNGHLCYITSNKWMRAGYGEKLRTFLANRTNPQLLVDFGGVKVFESATVDTNILLFSKSTNAHNTRCAVTNKQNKDALKQLSVFVQQQGTSCDFSGGDSWVILSPIEQSIKRKIEAVGTPLKNWDINIYRGVLTGYNDAFIISTEKRNEILANCQTEDERKRTEELIRPILRGRDIKRYSYEWAEQWLIATFPARHYDIERFPAVKKYLESFAYDYLIKNGYAWIASNYLSEYCRKKLEQSGKDIIINGKPVLDAKGTKEKSRKKTSNKWFETQDSISYWEDFKKPKIIYADITQKLSFAISTNGEFLNNTSYFFCGCENDTLNYLLKILNSNLFDWYYRTISVQLGEKAVRMFSIYVLRLPVPIFKNNIDALTTYQIYGLSKDEEDYIESLSE